MITDPITQAEETILSRIKELLGSRVRQVASLPGDLDAETLKRMLITAPGVYVSFGGGSRAGEHPVRILSRWSVFVITGHASGQTARRTGDLVQSGAYALVAILAGALHGIPLSPPDSGGDSGGVGSLELSDVQNLFTGAIDAKGCSLYGLTFTLPLEFPPEVDPDTLADFLRLHAEYPPDAVDLVGFWDYVPTPPTPEPPQVPTSYSLHAYLDGQAVDFVDLVRVDSNGAIVINVRWPDTIEGGQL